jgi:ABC-2 type transport system permease protein
VLSKASIPLIVLPLLSFAIVVATQLIMLLLSSLGLLGSALSVTTLWTPVF